MVRRRVLGLGYNVAIPSTMPGAVLAAELALAMHVQTEVGPRPGIPTR